MKPASDLFNPEHTGNYSTDSQKSSSTHGHYIGVTALLAIVCMLTAWLGFAPDTLTSSPAWSGFAYFWLAGGLVTLFLLALAAKR